MIDAYVWTTPNGHKLLIALEELAIPYELHWIDIGKGDQKTPAYIAINPNSKIPALVDRDGAGGAPVTVFESDAVLTYLADKTGKLLPAGGAERYRALSWMAWNVAGPGPTLGQVAFFTKRAPHKIDWVIERFTDEAKRQFGVLDRRLAESRYLAGDAYTFADVINFTWPQVGRTGLGLDTAPFPHLTRWLDEIAARPAVVKALAMKPPGK